MASNSILSSLPAVAAGVLVSVWCVNGAAQSDSNAWVTDELSTYVRSGPTDGYRIVGTLSAGEQGRGAGNQR